MVREEGRGREEGWGGEEGAVKRMAKQSVCLATVCKCRLGSLSFLML